MEECVKKQRLNKTLAAAGVASRRGCDELIFSGRIAINGVVTKRPQTRVNPQKDFITYDNTTITLEKQVYYILNKPPGYLCTAKSYAKSVLKLFRDVGERLFTVGRLDKDTQGLLIVTNDGDYAQQVIHPSANIQKEYIAKTDQEITDTHLKTLAQGTLVEGVFITPFRVQKVRKGTVKIVVKEGKKREVRNLLAAAGLQVRSLTRVRIGNLRLNRLPIGQWRPLTHREKVLPFEG